jgi:hypothetical protein
VAKLREDIKAQAEPFSAPAIRILKTRVAKEIEAVKTTESKFKEVNDNSEGEAAAIFFADLRLSYSDVLSQLSEQQNEGNPHIKTVSLNPIKAAKKTRDTIPLLASGVLRVFEQNATAYSLVADSKSLIFDLEVNSNPEGAAVSYRRRGDPFKGNSAPTNCVLKALPLAIWTIHFQLSGYKEQDIEFNAIVDRNRRITANLTK